MPVAAASDAAAARAGEASARWLDALQRVVARAAHEINNALNGAVVNLEVVRLRAVPGKDAGAAAPFAEAGAAQLDGAVRLVEALTALTRAPRGPADVAATLRQLGVLLAPTAAHDAITFVVDAEGAVRSGAPPAAVRWALAEALLAALDAGAAPQPGPVTGPVAGAVPAPIARAGRSLAAVEPGDLDGAVPAPAPARVVRCVLEAAREPTVRFESPASLSLAGDAAAILRTCGIDVGYQGSALILAFPPLAG